jgi:hypothetical protein
MRDASTWAPARCRHRTHCPDVQNVAVRLRRWRLASPRSASSVLSVPLLGKWTESRLFWYTCCALDARQAGMQQARLGARALEASGRTSIRRAAPSVMANGQEKRPEDGANRYSLANWIRRLRARACSARGRGGRRQANGEPSPAPFAAELALVARRDEASLRRHGLHLAPLRARLDTVDTSVATRVSARSAGPGAPHRPQASKLTRRGWLCGLSMALASVHRSVATASPRRSCIARCIHQAQRAGGARTSSGSAAVKCSRDTCLSSTACAHGCSAPLTAEEGTTVR